MTSLHRWLVSLVLLPVALYRRWISPLKRAPSCRYLPTCSEYAIEAVKTRGIVVGTSLAVWRVLRCNPLFHAGYDPVPRRAAREAAQPAATTRCAHRAQEQL
jgi:putative membrane protein insertion efficiency factor